MYAFESSLKTLVWGTEQWLSPTESEFPLLVKFIETHMPLSIQVHPDDALAAERHHCLGKTEMWYVLDVEPGAYVYAGLTRSVSRDEVAAMVADGTITSVLRRCDVQKGDVVFLPAGCIHALGPGLKVVEIQENSAITYRLYDYNRPGLDGKPRQLHVAEAMDAIDYAAHDACYHYRPAALHAGTGLLVDCDHFRAVLTDPKTIHVTYPGGDFDIDLTRQG